MPYDDFKSHKNQGFTLCLEDTIFEKPQGGGSQIDPPPHPPPPSAGLGLRLKSGN